MVIRITGTTGRPDIQEESNPMPTPFRMLDDLFSGWAMRNALAHRQEQWKPPVDILEKNDKLFIRSEIPGIEENDLELKLDGRTLTIKGERKAEAEGPNCTYHRIESYQGTFARSFDLPDSVDVEKISAAFQNGVLTITIPQKPEVKPRMIKISQGK
jgi:HSP20 family protein